MESSGEEKEERLLQEKVAASKAPENQELRKRLQEAEVQVAEGKKKLKEQGKCYRTGLRP